MGKTLQPGGDAGAKAKLGIPSGGFGTGAVTLTSSDQIVDAINVMNVSAGEVQIPITETFIVDAGIASSKTVSVANSIKLGSENVTFNSLLMIFGAGEDYTISGADVVFNAGHTLTIGDKISVKYVKA